VLIDSRSRRRWSFGFLLSGLVLLAACQETSPDNGDPANQPRQVFAFTQLLSSDKSDERRVEMHLESSNGQLVSMHSMTTGDAGLLSETVWTADEPGRMTYRDWEQCATSEVDSPFVPDSADEIIADIAGPERMPSGATLIAEDPKTWRYFEGVATIEVMELGQGRLDRTVSSWTDDRKGGTSLSDFGLRFVDEPPDVRDFDECER
jgi:hypothetical protein